MKIQSLSVFTAGVLLACAGFASAAEPAQITEKLQTAELQPAAAEEHSGAIALTDSQMDNVSAGARLSSFAFASAQVLNGFAFAATNTSTISIGNVAISSAIGVAIAIGPGAQATAISIAR